MRRGALWWVEDVTKVLERSCRLYLLTPLQRDGDVHTDVLFACWPSMCFRLTTCDINHHWCFGVLVLRWYHRCLKVVKASMMVLISYNERWWRWRGFLTESNAFPSMDLVFDNRNLQYLRWWLAVVLPVPRRLVFGGPPVSHLPILCPMWVASMMEELPC